MLFSGANRWLFDLNSPDVKSLGSGALDPVTQCCFSSGSRYKACPSATSVQPCCVIASAKYLNIGGNWRFVLLPWSGVEALLSLPFRSCHCFAFCTDFAHFNWTVNCCSLCLQNIYSIIIAIIYYYKLLY